MVLYGEYIQSMTLSQYFSKTTSLEKFYDFFVFSLKILRTFRNHKIIHKDLKENNILVSNSSTFHVVDFGNSMDIANYLNKQGTLVFESRVKELLPFFIYAPYHHYWTPEYHLISYLFSCIHKKQVIQDDSLDDLCEQITTNNLIYSTEKDKNEAKTNMYDYFTKRCMVLKHHGDYMKYNEKKYVKCIEKLSRSSYASWDSYAICYTSLRILNRINVSNIPMMKMLLDGLHYDCRKRLKLKYIIKRFRECLHHELN
tara:strand:- start:1094 stop:1861 length:768 start_codon:yes stop_codon:yes gene_type:complete